MAHSPKPKAQSSSPAPAINLHAKPAIPTSRLLRPSTPPAVRARGGAADHRTGVETAARAPFHNSPAPISTHIELTAAVGTPLARLGELHHYDCARATWNNVVVLVKALKMPNPFVMLDGGSFKSRESWVRFS